MLISPDRVLQTQSLTDGFFSFENVPIGLYEMQISATGFLKQQRSIDFRNYRAMQPLSIVLKIGNLPDMDACGRDSTLEYQPPGSTSPHLAGIVRDFAGGKPIKNANVTVWRTSDHSVAFKTKTDRAGRFAMEEIPPGYYDLRISSGGHNPVEIKKLLIPLENAVRVEATAFEAGRTIVCQ